MTHEERARELTAQIAEWFNESQVMAETMTRNLIAAAFAEIKSDTLRDAENAAFDALTRHGFTGARYCVIAAIRGLIDTPTELAAPDPREALANDGLYELPSIQDRARAILRWCELYSSGNLTSEGTWDQVKQDAAGILKLASDMEAALRLAETGG